MQKLWQTTIDMMTNSKQSLITDLQTKTSKNIKVYVGTMVAQYKYET